MACEGHDSLDFLPLASVVVAAKKEEGALSFIARSLHHGKTMLMNSNLLGYAVLWLLLPRNAFRELPRRTTVVV